MLLVEGQTEEAFSNIVLRQHLLPFGVLTERASLLRTRELPAGSPYKGGVTTYGRIARDARRLLQDTDAVVTTLIDFYGLPDDFPSFQQTSSMASADRVALLESAFAADIGHPRFRPFLMLHEFEAWVFASPSHAGEHAGLPGLQAALETIVEECGGAEHINHSPTTHPSMRLAALWAGHRKRYGKVADGPEIVRKAGLQAIRAACPHFASWLTWLENLGA